MHQPTPPETLARILELARQTPRLTQTTIAKRCGVTQGFVSRYCGKNGIARRTKKDPELAPGVPGPGVGV